MRKNTTLLCSDRPLAFYQFTLRSNFCVGVLWLVLFHLWNAQVDGRWSPNRDHWSSLALDAIRKAFLWSNDKALNGETGQTLTHSGLWPAIAIIHARHIFASHPRAAPTTWDLCHDTPIIWRLAYNTCVCMRVRSNTHVLGEEHVVALSVYSLKLGAVNFATLSATCRHWSSVHTRVSLSHRFCLIEFAFRASVWFLRLHVFSMQTCHCYVQHR